MLRTSTAVYNTTKDNLLTRQKEKPIRQLNNLDSMNSAQSTDAVAGLKCRKWKEEQPSDNLPNGYHKTESTSSCSSGDVDMEKNDESCQAVGHSGPDIVMKRSHTGEPHGKNPRETSSPIASEAAMGKLQLNNTNESGKSPFSIYIMPI